MPVHLFNWPLLRLLAWTKRAALALERIALAQERLADYTIPARRPPRPTEFGVMDTAAINARWQEEHPDAPNPL